MSKLNQATLTNDSTLELYGEPIVRFSMNRVDVDGVTTERDIRLFDNWFFSLKPEFDSEDNPADTGGMNFRWNPDRLIDERHWLVCGEVVAYGEYCRACGRIAS